MFKSRFFFFVVLLFAFFVHSEAQVSWEKYSSPVVPVWGGNVNDPSGYKYTYNPTVLFDSTANLYRMWYCYQAFGFGVQWCIGYAISTDGINWFMYSKNPVLVPGGSGSFDSNSLFDPFVVKVGNEFRIYYDGYDGTIFQTGVATSTDGISWTKYSGNPVLTVRPSTWESIGCNSAKVFYNGLQFLMIYTGHASLSQAEVGVATSADGFVWTRNPLNPVLRRGSTGNWDQNSVRGSGAFVSSGVYYLMYDGGAFTSNGFATSPDGITWTKYSGNPVFGKGNSGTWDEGRAELGSIVRQGSQLKFWYSGYGYNALLGGSVWQIGYASSTLVTLSANEGSVLPDTYSLAQAFPNPFNPEAEIGYSIPKAEHVILKIFDTLGREIETLVDEIRPAGKSVVRWKPALVSSGTYFYKMQSGTFSETRKMVLLK